MLRLSSQAQQRLLEIPRITTEKSLALTYPSHNLRGNSHKDRFRAVFFRDNGKYADWYGVDI